MCLNGAWKLTFAVWLAGILCSISGYRERGKHGANDRHEGRGAAGSCGSLERGPGTRPERTPRRKHVSRFEPSWPDPFAGSSIGRASRSAEVRHRRSEVRSLPREPHRGSSAQSTGLRAGGRRFNSSPLYRADSSAGRAPSGVKASLEVGCSIHPPPTHGNIAQPAEQRLDETVGREFDPRCSHPCVGPR